MPLIQSKSKKAFSKNVAKEMDAGKPQKQALAISYDVKRKNARKKMAEGGAVSAKAEKRPMPDQTANDAAMASRNSSKAPLMAPANWDQNPMIPKPKTQAIKHPRMVPSNAFSVRMRDEEDHLQSSAAVNDGPQEQPPKHDNEEMPNRQGPKVHPMKMMAKGGNVSMEMGAGPEADSAEHPAGLESDNDQMAPKSDEYMAGYMEAKNKYAAGGMIDEDEASMPENQDSQNYAPAQSEAEVDEEEARLRKADGGMIDLDEMEDEKHSSIAAAIMAKNNRMHPGSDSDEDMMLANGGMVDIDENAEEQPNDYYHQNEAALKENYDSDMDGMSQPMDSNEHSDMHEMDAKNKEDMISAIRSKMNKRKQFR